MTTNQTVTSTAFAAHNIAHALSKVTEVIDGQWMKPKNDLQQWFMDTYYQVLSSDFSLLQDVLEAIAARDAKTINRFLAKKGFSIRVDEIPEHGFAVASVFDLLVDWVTPGKIKDLYLRNDDHCFPGVEMNIGKDNALYQLDGHPHPLVKLRTKQGYNVLFTEIDNAESYNERDLLELANNFSSLQRTQNRDYSKIHFPMVHLDCEVDISWLVNMVASGEAGTFGITRALKQVILKVNDKGARAKSAVALELRSAPSKPIYTVQGPFLLWFEKAGLSNSPFAALCGRDCWKNPGNITRSRSFKNLWNHLLPST